MESNSDNSVSSIGDEQMLASQTNNCDDKEVSSSSLPEYCRALRITDSNGHVKELIFPKMLDLDRPKRARTTFSTEQLDQLEHEFQRAHYLVGKDRHVLARRLGLSQLQVKVWFQNRRTKHKREQQKQEEAKKSTAETVAACNVLRLLQQHRPLIDKFAYTSFP